MIFFQVILNKKWYLIRSKHSDLKKLDFGHLTNKQKSLISNSLKSSTYSKLPIQLDYEKKNESHNTSFFFID